MQPLLRKPHRRLAWMVLAGIVLVTVSGCAGKLTKVRGIVKLDGNPLGGAGVDFEPIGGRGQPARGITDTDGSFHVDTHTPDDGAWPGEYKVVITKYEVDPAMTQPIDPSDPQAMAKRYAAAAKANSKPRKYVVPAVYRSAETTPLRFKVPEDINKTLELSSTGK